MSRNEAFDGRSLVCCYSSFDAAAVI